MHERAFRTPDMSKHSGNFMGNTLRQIRKRGFAAALTITAVLAFGTLAAVPANAVEAVPGASVLEPAPTGSGAITGTLTKNVDGIISPAANIAVHLYRDGATVATNANQTDASGVYAVGSLTAGDYKVSFAQYGSSTGLVPEFFNDKTDLASAQVVSVATGEVVNRIDAELAGVVVPPVVVPQLGGISGKLTQKSVEGVVLPASGLDIAVYNATDDSIVTWAHSDADGAYSAAALVAGSYKVSFGVYASSTGLVPEYFENKPDLATATPIAVDGLTTVPGINAELDATVVVPTPTPTETPAPTDTATPTPTPTPTTTPTTAPVAAVTTVETVSVTVDGVTVTVPGAPIAQGGGMVVAAAGFEPFEVVEIWLYSTPVLLGTLTANAQGEISGSFSVPAGTPSGTHHIIMKDEAGVETQSAAITVVAKTATKQVATKSVLADTGTDVSGGWFALVFLLLGGLAVTVGARSRTKLEPTSN